VLGSSRPFGDGEAVQRSVELAVAASVEAVAVDVSRGRGDRCGPAIRVSLASVANRAMPAISPISLAAVSTPQPCSASSRGARFATSSASSRSRASIDLGELADAPLLVARDPHARGRFGARKAPGDAVPPAAARGPPAAPQAASRGPRAGPPWRSRRYRRIGLAALASRAARAGHQPSASRADPLAAAQQKALQRPGHVHAGLQRPHAFAIQRRAHTSRSSNERCLALTVRSAITRPVTARPRGRCASACGCPPRSRSYAPSLRWDT
jgi:hypothetical protein